MVDTAVVLAAGEGTRLRPLTRNRPKPMLPAANRPILEHVLDALVEAGTDHVVIVVGYKHDRVQNHFGPTYRDVPITYARQNKQLGTGHALLQAREHVEGPMLVVNGDCLIDSALVQDVCAAFDRGGGEPTLAVLEGPDARQYGAVTLRDGFVQEIIEKPQVDEYRLINAGIYAFDDDIFEAIDATPREDGELALTDTLARELERGRIRGVETDGLWVDASYPWDLLVVAAKILDHGLADEPERDERVWVDETAIIHDDATLQPPVVVGPDCEVGPGAVVGPHSALGRNVTVGANATVVNSVLDVDTRVEVGSTLLETVTGQNVRLGPCSVVSGGPADVRVGNEVFEDEELGAVIADRVRAEGNVGFAPGSLVGPNAHLDTGVTVDGQVRESAEVRR
ncbi:bifunctional sugar-1-phosphate nucleotidylyltransferase/acetyltransferase [Halapricum hydrolyticum]|uniref:Bifunctional protein GlmU n=1 Tax=Halapricum hydrolyticum TaxID=2979991 RepID=A0AAE3ICD6_9EURY|nr:bifunctional sugar-1-phosphate nucleotidylyltransferase/acetyltransferase [Halapricum hydrolyticum]MCU4717077.1 sugar phosphate nucleotidyltransferase [Halapricum hydrolyticum]MCU4726004.1 sugar phosphate nucleotidyltransferase [Halapricum hydrolyticum]